MFLIVILVLGVIGIALIANAGNAARRSGRALHARVIELEDVTQHDYATITAKLGNPNSVSSMASGVTLAQWIRPSYHVAMSFDQDHRCLGIDHEVAV